MRQALPRFAGLIDRRALFSLAGRDDVEARLIARTRGGWRVTRGPLTPGRRSANGAALARAWLADLFFAWYRQGYLRLERGQ